MKPTTPESSVKDEPKYTPEVRARFDGLLDLVSAKNVKIGQLIEELSHSRNTMEKALDSVIPSVRSLLERRIRSADEVLQKATH